MRRLTWIVAGVVVAAWGCGDDDGAAPADGGGAGDAAIAADAGVTPVAPAPAALPVLTPCPGGWREVPSDEGVTACDPWPASGHATCAAVDEAHFPGEPGCARVGSACPAGDLPEGLPAGAAVLYVSASAAGGGDGSLAAPFVRIRDAMTRAAVGTIVAVGKGTYDEVIALRGGVTLWGACARDTVLRSTLPSETAAVVEPTGTGAVVRNVQIADSVRPAVIVQGAGRTLELDDVVVRHTQGLALVSAGGAHLVARGLVVRDTQPTAAGRFGRALEVSAGASADLERAALERNRDLVLFVGGAGGSIVASNIAVRESTAEASSLLGGRGLSVQDGATATVTASVFEDNREVGIFLTGASARVRLESCVVRDTRSRDLDGLGGRGVDASNGATAELVKTLVERNRDVGALATRNGTLVLEDSIVRDNLPEQTSMNGGNGVLLRSGAHAELRRVLLSQNREVGAQAIGPDTTMLVEDGVVVDTAMRATDGYGGFGLAVTEGASMEVHRARIERNHAVGIVPDASSLTLEDVVVRDTAARSDGEWGRGLNAQNGATATVVRGLFERNREYAVQADGATTTLGLEEVVIRDTLGRDVDGLSGTAIVAQEGAMVDVAGALIEHCPEAAVIATAAGTVVRLERVLVRDALGEMPTGFFGRGIAAQYGARVEATGVRIERMLDIGVFAGGPGTIVTLVDVQIDGVAGRLCATSTCLDTPFGFGVGAYEGAIVSATGFSIRNASLCGVQVAVDGELDLSDGEISGCTIGACVQVDGYDFMRLSTGIAYRDNERNLETTMLPVPSAAPTLGGM